MRPNRHAAWIVLVAGLALFGVMSFYVKSAADHAARGKFAADCAEIHDAIADRLDDHARILVDGAALFYASDSVSRREWKIFTQRQKVEAQLPGIQGIGFSLVIPRTELDRHLLEVRDEGFPEYAVRPAGDRDLYTSIIYIEPFADRNLRAFGYDMMTEPVRRAAMEQAMDADLPALSGKVVLVQETGKNKQAGTLMYVPVYRNGMPIETVTQRRAAIYGWVYSPYRMTDLMQGVLGNGKLKTAEQIRLTLYDGDQPEPERLLYESARATNNSGRQADARFTLQMPIDFNGHRWTLALAQASPGIFSAEYSMMWIAMVGGLVIALLIFALILVLQGATTEAQRIAERLTINQRESEQSYRNQFTQNSSVMLLVDPVDGAIIDANAAAGEFYGYPRERLLAMNVAALNTLSVGEIRQAMASVESGLSNRFQFRHRVADGSLRDVEVASSPVLFGGRTLLHSIVQDVSGRKRVEEELAQVAERLSLAAHAGGVGIWDYSVADNALVWDDEMYRLYGISAEQFVGAYEAWQSGMHPDDRQRGDDEIQMALRGEKEFDTEFRVQWPDGTIRNIRALAIVQRNAEGEPVRMIGTNWDITAHKQSEESIARSEAKFHALFDSTSDAVMLLDERGFFDCNEAALGLLGCGSREEFCSKHPADLSPPQQPCGTDSMKLAGEWIAAAVATGSQRFEWTHRRADTGAPFPAEVVLSAIQIDGRPAVQAVVRDITERTAAVAALETINRQLEEATVRAVYLTTMAESASVAKSDFLANMSHEIRTPMNGVIGMTGLLMDTDLTADQLRYARTIRGSGEALLALINDILDFSKIEAGKLELETVDFDLHGMLDDFIGMMALRAHEKGLELGCIVAPEVPPGLRGDPGRLRQILINLVGNAVKFTADGEVVVRVSVAAETRDDVLLRFGVQDTGMGIPQDRIGRLFGKFSQVDSSTARVHGGTGLGLAISKQLSEIMGGEIGVRSEEGAGSEFWFTARLPKASSLEPGAKLADVDLRGARVLVVDDTAVNREILQVLLTSWGLRPVEAAGGRAALRALADAKAAGDPFSIAILDMKMPEMDGADLARAIRADSDLQATRLVMCTSIGETADGRLVENGGFAAILTKPVKRQELREALETAVRGGKPAAARTKATPGVELAPELRHARILVVEDNITNQMVAVGILKKLGLKADVAANGLEAIRALETIPYDLVLMDVQMPEMDGIEATRQIRDPQSRVLDQQVPIVAMTAHAMGSDQERCLQAGMDDYITKPVRVATLVKALEEWLRQGDDARPRRENSAAPEAVTP